MPIHNMNITNLITLCIITNTCRGCQLPGDVYAGDTLQRDYTMFKSTSGGGNELQLLTLL